MHFLSSIEMRLLKVTKIDFFKYEVRERFLISEMDFFLRFPAE